MNEIVPLQQQPKAPVGEPVVVDFFQWGGRTGLECKGEIYGLAHPAIVTVTVGWAFTARKQSTSPPKPHSTAGNWTWPKLAVSAGRPGAWP